MEKLIFNDFMAFDRMHGCAQAPLPITPIRLGHQRPHVNKFGHVRWEGKALPLREDMYS